MNMLGRRKAESIAEEMAGEYDFGSLGRPVRGKFHERMKAGSNLVLLDPDVSEAFPTTESVNDALRSLMKIAATVRTPPSAPRPSKRRSR